MTRIAMRLLAPLVFATLGVELPAQPAQSGTGRPQFRADVELVRLDVTVLDGNRKPVRGLTAADFTVEENGQQLPIEAFAAVDLPHALDQPAGWTREVGSDVATNQLDVQRIVVIIMDDGTTTVDHGTVTSAKQIARAVIEQLGPNDLAAVVFTYRGRSQNFTSDRSRLIAAADTFLPQAVSQPGRWTAENSRRPNPFAGPPLGCAFMGRRGCVTATLQAVAGVLDGTPPGRKAIVLISPGIAFDFSMANLELGEDIDDLQQTLRSLQRANVNVYPFDPRGLTYDGILAPGLDSLRTLAEYTGGRATFATNTPSVHVPQVFVENSSYYLLGIRPSGSGGFRRIAVTVARPDAEVRVRAGYFAPADSRPARETRPAARLSGFDKAFGSALPSGDLPLEVTAVAIPLDDRSEAAVIVTTGIRRFSGGGSVEAFELRTAAFDPSSYRERAAHRQTGELNAPPNARGGYRFDIHSKLLLRPGRYEIRVAAAAGSETGGVFTHVDVPDFRKARLSLSEIILGAVPTTRDSVVAGLAPVLPTAARVFGRVPVSAVVRVHQGGRQRLAPVRVHARLVDAGERILFDEAALIEPEGFQPARSAEYRVELPVARLPDGDYLSSIEALAGSTTTSRRVRFRVQNAGRSEQP